MTLNSKIQRLQRSQCTQQHTARKQKIAKVGNFNLLVADMSAKNRGKWLLLLTKLRICLLHKYIFDCGLVTEVIKSFGSTNQFHIKSDSLFQTIEIRNAPFASVLIVICVMVSTVIKALLVDVNTQKFSYQRIELLPQSFQIN